MKIYLNLFLLSIFFSVFAVTDLAIAQTPTSEEVTTQDEVIDEEVSESDSEAVESEAPTADNLTNNIIFVQCPATELVTDSEVNSEIDSEPTDQEPTADISSSQEPEDIIIDTKTVTEAELESIESEEVVENSDSEEIVTEETTETEQIVVA